MRSSLKAITPSMTGNNHERSHLHSVAVALTFALATLGSVGPAIHYAPAAAYVLTDRPVIEALTRAASRGVLVSIYHEGSQLANQEPGAVFDELKCALGIQVRVKRKDKPFMHMKAYQIDGLLLRTGSANSSASGLKRLDNDLVVIDSAERWPPISSVISTRSGRRECHGNDSLFPPT
jgi:phosphatidylserine/phosphatidylglycerophosphate/cardiolipin synthase-like enzyme